MPFIEDHADGLGWGSGTTKWKSNLFEMEIHLLGIVSNRGNIHVLQSYENLDICKHPSHAYCFRLSVKSVFEKLVFCSV